jgi:predicted amidohydrolase
MKIASIQSDLVWENPEANRIAFLEKIEAIAAPVDLIVLPEMFTTGFTMNPLAVAETMEGKTVVWMQTVAKAKNAALTGSVIIEEEGQYYNRMLFVFPSGEIQHYNKRHLFALAGEDKVYAKGDQKLIVDYLGWKICLLVCYDLRFPVFSRNNSEYDLLIYVANWPKVRINAWNILLAARAIENIAYVVGVNRVGYDGNNHFYNGQSQVVDGLGALLVASDDASCVTVITLDKEQLYSLRTKLSFLNDRDDFTLN